MLPRITVVTPSYNQGSFLEATLSSVLDQGYPNLEYIVVDGGSSDGSVDIIRKYASRLAWWCSEPDGGHYDAVNKGFSRATGDVLCWLNSDDLHFPWTLHAVGEVMASFPEVEWLSTLKPGVVDCRGCLHRLDALPGFSRTAFADGRYHPGRLGVRQAFGVIQQESTFWRRGLFERVGGLRTQFKLAGDVDLWARFYLQTELYGYPVPLAAFRRQYRQRSAAIDRYTEEAARSLSEFRQATGWSAPKWRMLLDPLVKRVPGLRSALNRRWTYVGRYLSRVDFDFPTARWILAEQAFQ